VGSTLPDENRLRALVKAGVAITAELSLDALLQRLVEAAAALTRARFAALGVIDRERSGLERFLGPRSDALSAHPAHADGAAERAPGLYFCGFTVSPPGMLREIGIEAHRIAQHISRKP